MTDDLIERLREMRENWKAAYLSLASLTFGEAADRIEAQAAEIGHLREMLAAAYIELSGKNEHASDCATSNAPAMMPGRCDCD
jgi:histidinol-phosphate/aromatic aminotransferase/cobyric acid decarboxylase-like protein